MKPDLMAKTTEERTIMETTMKMTRKFSLRNMLFMRVLIVGVISLAGCSSSAGEDDATKDAAKIEDIQGSPLKRVTLTKEAAARIDLKTEDVKIGPSGLEIPYGAVLYDPDGKTWAFVNVKGLSFQRTAITVEKIVGDVASLTKGPDEGTKVVTLGATQLYGAEIGVGDE